MRRISNMFLPVLLLCEIGSADTVVGKKAQMINSPIETFDNGHRVSSRGQLASDAKTEESPGKLVVSAGVEYFEVTNPARANHLNHKNIKAIKLIIDTKPWQDALDSNLSARKITEVKASGNLEIEGDSEKTTEKVSCTYTKGPGVKIVNTDYLIECRSKENPSFDHFEVTLRYANITS